MKIKVYVVFIITLFITSCNEESIPPFPEVEVIITSDVNIFQEGSNDKLDITIRLSKPYQDSITLYFADDRQVCFKCTDKLFQSEAYAPYGGNLFDQLYGVIGFSAGKTEKNFSITFKDNEYYEEGGSIHLPLTFMEANGSYKNVEAKGISIDFNYENNDALPIIGFENASEVAFLEEVSTNDTWKFITLSNAYGIYDFELEFSGTAQAGVDYQILAPENLMVDGQDSEVIKLFKILNDNVAEGLPPNGPFNTDNEYIDVEVVIDNAILGNGSNSPLRSKLRFYIVDNEDN